MRFTQLIPAAASVFAATLASAAEPVVSPTWKFIFGSGADVPGYTHVLPTSTFSPDTGFGFEPGADVVAVDRSGNNAPGGSFLSFAKPSRFSVAVPEGNYNVKVILGDAQGTADVTIKAESRRLMLEHVQTPQGQFVTRTFTVNTRTRKLPPVPKNAPGGTEVITNEREVGSLTWDDKLTFEINGSAPKISGLEIEKVDCPTVFVAGDSTVTDQPSEPGASWGQMLTRFFKPGIAVANYAESGETMKSFIAELRLAKILSFMKNGDWLLIQFGHNDEKASWPQTYVEAHTTYKAYLKVFIAEARLRGANPVLVTPVQRRNFDAEGKITNSHGDYPKAVREVAAEENVPLIDLDQASVKFYEALGRENAPKAFSAGGSDATHHNNYGAYELAKAVVQGLRDQKTELATWIVDDFAGFDPAKPDPLDTFAVPASPSGRYVTPRGN
jgi:lysophospholipase L1-like esterase